MIQSDRLDYRHVDVFATAAYRGNGLIVAFCDTLDRPAEQLRRITEEMRQFETIFVATTGDVDVIARIFTAEEELPFAGHPVIGAAAALHERLAHDRSTVNWRFVIDGRPVRVTSERDDTYFTATMDQGPAQSAAPLADDVREASVGMLGLEPHELLPLPLQVVSTGLPYLIVPVTPSGLENARIVGDRFETWLSGFGAKFVYVFDPHAREGRTWDNAGKVEDIATGSAAGPAAAYLFEYELAPGGVPLLLAQGRFVGRPSTIAVTRDSDDHLWVGGPVRPVASGTLELEGTCAS